MILAAGLGTRMKSELPKVLHEVCGRPMLSYIVDAALSLSPERLVVVTGADQDAVEEVLPPGCERAIQQDRRGTGDAVRAGLETLVGFDGDVMVLYGDVPLVDAAFAQELAGCHWAADAAATLTTVRLDDPAHYGRVVRDERRPAWRASSNTATPAPVERAIDEINVGLYVFRSAPLRAALAEASPRTTTRASSTSPTSCTC